MQIFFPFHRLSFQIVGCVFCCAELLVFLCSPTSLFLFCCLCFWCYIQNVAIISTWQTWLCVSSSEPTLLKKSIINWLHSCCSLIHDNYTEILPQVDCLAFFYSQLLLLVLHYYCKHMTPQLRISYPPPTLYNETSFISFETVSQS